MSFGKIRCWVLFALRGAEIVLIQSGMRVEMACKRSSKRGIAHRPLVMVKSKLKKNQVFHTYCILFLRSQTIFHIGTIKPFFLTYGLFKCKVKNFIIGRVKSPAKCSTCGPSRFWCCRVTWYIANPEPDGNKPTPCPFVMLIAQFTYVLSQQLNRALKVVYWYVWLWTAFFSKNSRFCTFSEVCASFQLFRVY